MNQTSTTSTTSTNAPDMRLFWGCFLALIATAFGFIARVLTSNEWGTEFGLSQTQIGEINGVGLWPFAISIVLFSLVIDRIGYKAAMWFGLCCHILSTVIIFIADGYGLMYVGTFILALGSGTVEAYINPVVATMFKENKPKWLNILHAGWPGGMVLGGLIVILLVSGLYWKYKIALVLIPAVIYAIMLAAKHFPVQERVAMGVSYKEMLGEVGAIGAAIVSFMILAEIGRLAGFDPMVGWVGAALVGTFFFLYTKSWGQPLYIILLLIMMILATTELGVDSWIPRLMEGPMEQLFGSNGGGWVLLYTSLIMVVLRFYAGPVLKMAGSPLRLLAISALLAAIGLFFLSKAAGMMILVAATIYGFGKTFFWPTTLGVVSEQFPKGGAMTLNAIAGVGMLAVGTFGAPILGYLQDSVIEEELRAIDATDNTNLTSTYVIKENTSIIGKYKSLDGDKVSQAPQSDRDKIETVQGTSQKAALSSAAILPLIMLLCYIGLILFFKSKGGYKPVGKSTGH